MKAYPMVDGTYFLDGKTFHLKEKIKLLGGLWNGARWIISEDAIEPLRATKMFRVEHEKHCHEDAGTTYASQQDIDNGYVILGCGYCDKSYICGDKVKIVNVTKEVKG